MNVLFHKKTSLQKKNFKTSNTKIHNKVFQGTRFQNSSVKQAYSELNTVKNKLKESKQSIKKHQNINFSEILHRFYMYFEFAKLHTKLFFTRGTLTRSILETMTKVFTIVCIIGMIYICFFDTYFSTKNYKIAFANNSYLSSETISSIIHELQSTRGFGIFPLHSYWFANTEQMTLAAQNHHPEIQKIHLTQRTWPDILDLEITTAPVLATLHHNGKAYVVSQSGQVLGEDAISLASNPIILNTMSKPAEFLTTQSLQKNNLSLLNKIYFTLKVQSLLQNRDLVPTQLTISSDLSIDPDVTVMIGKTKVYFSSNSLSLSNLKKRIDTFFSSAQFIEQIQSEKIRYIDMRFAKNITVCFTDSECSRTF